MGKDKAFVPSWRDEIKGPDERSKSRGKARVVSALQGGRRQCEFTVVK